MVKSRSIDKIQLGLSLICLLLLLWGFSTYYLNPIKNEQQGQEQIYQDVIETAPTIQYTNTNINTNPSLSRLYNPLAYPYKSPQYYDQTWYPDLQLPAQVIGCGARNTPCLGGTQIPIANPMFPVDISDANIAPVNIRTRGPRGQVQQVGLLSQVFGSHNSVLPLFGRKRYPNGDMWDYYTMISGVKVEVVAKREGEEIGNNDVVYLKGVTSAAYRSTIYESDFPQYVPYVT